MRLLCKLAPIALSACVSVDTSQDERVCHLDAGVGIADFGQSELAEQDGRLQSDAGHDTAQQGDVAPTDCNPLGSLRCATDDLSCETVFRCATIDLDFRQDRLPRGVSLSRASPAYYVSAAGTLVLAPVDAPRFDYDPSTGRRLGLLVEGERTNLIRWSSALERWNTENLVLKDVGLVAPSGESALVLEATGGLVAHRLNLEPIPSMTYTWLTLSFYVKPLRQDHGLEVQLNALNNIIGLSYDLDNGRVLMQSGSLYSSGRAERFPGGWTLIGFSGFWPGGAVTSPIELSIGIVARGSLDPVEGDGRASFALWGAQLEQGAVGSSHIPTNGSPATRPADTVSYVANPAADLSAGSLLLEAVYPYVSRENDRQPAVLEVTGPTSELLFSTNQELELRASTAVGSVALLADRNRFTAGRPHRMVLRGKYDQWELYEDATRAAQATEALGLLEGVRFGFGGSGVRDPFFGHIRRLAYWPAPLPRPTLEVLAR
jgi:hypothetical protein